MNPNILTRKRYTFFIDESGDSGVERVSGIEASGASPYMTLGGVLIPSSRFDKVNKAILRIEKEIGKEIHCNSLNHMQKRYCATEIAKLQILCFGVISDKKTLRDYRDEIDRNHALYYNKCAQFLLECLAHFMARYGIPTDDVNIVFERGNYDYSAFRNLIRRCQRTPGHSRTKLLRKINLDQIFNKPKNDEPLLKLADIVAHALYKTVHRSPRDYALSEFSYLKDLSEKFYSHDKTGNVLNYGIKPIHYLSQLNLDMSSVVEFKNMKTTPRPLPRDTVSTNDGVV